MRIACLPGYVVGSKKDTFLLLTPRAFKSCENRESRGGTKEAYHLKICPGGARISGPSRSRFAARDSALRKIKADKERC